MAQRKRNIEFSRPDEPTFLKKMKSRIGYKDNSAEIIDAKKEPLSKSNEIVDQEDEQPVFIVDKCSNITESELDEFKNKLKSEIEDSRIPQKDDIPTKILFKKPNKEDKLEQGGMQTTQSTKRNNSIERDQSKTKTSVAPVKNANLLSFDNEDDE